MDLRGSLVDTRLIIHPSTTLANFLKTIEINDDTPLNIVKYTKYKLKENGQKEIIKSIEIQVNSEDLANLKRIKESISSLLEGKSETRNINSQESSEEKSSEYNNHNGKNITEKSKYKNISDGASELDEDGKFSELYLTTSDIDWLFVYLQNKRKFDQTIPYLYELLEGIQIKMPENQIIKRNPVLEARCVKLRAQQEAREYRKMTKSVDNVRMRFPEDTISYQLKSMNRQLIAVGQFIISIFAGFLFGFRGVEWMVGHLDFGFRLLLGVMCALVIALAEIYFLAKKLNEELNIAETVQLGGPPKFANERQYEARVVKTLEKQHQD